MPLTEPDRHCRNFELKYPSNDIPELQITLPKSPAFEALNCERVGLVTSAHTRYPTGSFTSVGPQNPLIDVSKLY